MNMQAGSLDKLGSVADGETRSTRRRRSAREQRPRRRGGFMPWMFGIVTIMTVGSLAAMSMFTGWDPFAGIFGPSKEVVAPRGPIEVIDVHKVGRLEVATGATSMPVVYCNTRYSPDHDIHSDEYRKCDGLGDAKAIALITARASAVIDLEHLESRRIDINVAQRSVRLRLPAPTVTEPTTSGKETTIVMYEPSDVPIVGNRIEPDWITKAQTAAIPAAKRVLQASLAEPAAESARRVLTRMYTDAGFTDVNITVDQPSGEARA